jgi:hypothetical protein
MASCRFWFNGLAFLMKAQAGLMWRSLNNYTLPFTSGLVLSIVVVVVLEQVCEERQPNITAYDFKDILIFRKVICILAISIISYIKKASLG